MYHIWVNFNMYFFYYILNADNVTERKISSRLNIYLFLIKNLELVVNP
jgi:hypothetical protein